MLRSVVIRTTKEAPSWRVVWPSSCLPQVVSALQQGGFVRAFTASAQPHETRREQNAHPFSVGSSRTFATSSFEMPRQPRKSNPRRSDHQQQKPRGADQKPWDPRKPRGEHKLGDQQDRRPQRTFEK